MLTLFISFHLWQKFTASFAATAVVFKKKYMIILIHIKMEPIILVSPKTGGGQWVRASIALALLLPERPIHIQNIRHDKPNPGIHDQLLELVTVLVEHQYLQADLPKIGDTHLKIEGKKTSLTPQRPVLPPNGEQTFTIDKNERTTELSLIDEDTILVQIRKRNQEMLGSMHMQINTKGSTWLVIQALIVPIMVRGGHVTINGNLSHFNSIQGLSAYRSILQQIGLSDYVEIQFSDPSTVSLSNSRPIQQTMAPLSLKNLDLSWPFVESHQKNKKMRTIETAWREKVRQTTGNCVSGYDNWLMYIILLGGQIAIPSIVNERWPSIKDNGDGELIDPHVDTMLIFARTLIAQNVIDVGGGGGPPPPKPPCQGLTQNLRELPLSPKTPMPSTLNSVKNSEEMTCITGSHRDSL